MNPKEIKPQDGIIGPSPEEIKHFNTLHGPLPQPSGLVKGVAAVLGFGTAAFAVEACSRPAPPAEVRPAESILEAQGTIIAQQRQIEALQTAIAQTKSARPTPTFPPITPTFKPSPTETPKPVPTSPATTPSQERKEKEPISPLVLLPLKISETNISYSDDPKCQSSPESGWKYVNVQFAIENRSPTTQGVKLDMNILNNATLRSKDGFEYKSLVHFDSWNCLSSDTTWTTFADDIPQDFPSGFKVMGAFYKGSRRGSRSSRWLSVNDIANSFANRLSFRVGEKTTGYILNLPSFQELDLTKGPINANSLRFPTDRPNSDFKEVGTTIRIPGKGSVTFEEVVADRLESDEVGRNSKLRLRFRFANESKGYGNKFTLKVNFFGDDGILYTEYLESNKTVTVGHPVNSDEVPPGQEKIKEIEIITLGSVKSGKLVVAGDINEIFNVQLPNPH